MEPVYYVIAILGCSDGSAQCTPVATVPTHYTSQEACSSNTQDALLQNSGFDFPTLVAQCRVETARKTASQDQPEKIPAFALRG
jgi:hypothetical protein